MMAMVDPVPYQTLAVEQAGAVATVTLNRPAKRNAINARMFAELEAAFDQLSAEPSVRAFILTGAGGHFCSGVDVSAHDEMPASAAAMRERMAGIHRLVSKVFTCPKPGVAAVAGFAAGGGANLALACDLVVMADDAHFAELFVRRGLVMDMSGSFTLPRSVGLHRAKELALLGDTIDAARAWEIGIANRVVPAAEVTATAREIAVRLAAGPPVALALMKRALNESFSRTFDQALEQESADQSAAFMTSDVQEAIRAFLEKREPRFTGE